MVNIIGLGYIGLPILFMLSKNGVAVTGTDINTERIESLKNGSISFAGEKGMDELYADAFASGNISYSDKPVKADIYIIAVPTPCDTVTHKMDAGIVLDACKDVLKVCDDGSVIVIESTVVPFEFNEKLYGLAQQAGKNVVWAHTPERVIPGNLVYEFENNSRVIGCDDKIVAEKIKALYSVFCKGNIELTDMKTAELVKVIENSYRATNIAFANEIAMLCSRESIDIYEVIRLANMHPRVNILKPGPGVGGHCIPIDPWFLVAEADNTSALKKALEINDNMPDYVFTKIEDICSKNNIDIADIGIYGLTYKENVDDTRTSPTMRLMNIINHSGVSPICYDPFVHRKIYDNQCFDFTEFLDKSKFVIVMVAHNHIKQHKDSLKNKLVLDCCNCLGLGVSLF